MSEDLPALPAMSVLASTLEAMCAQIDERGTLDPVMMQVFFGARSELAVKIDNTINYVRFLESQEEFCEKLIESLKQRKRSIARVKESVKDYCKEVIIENPGLKFKGAYGSMHVRSNEKVDMKIELGSKSFANNLVEPEMFDLMPELRDYCEQITLFKVSKDMIKAMLKSGHDVDFADLVNDKSLVIK